MIRPVKVAIPVSKQDPGTGYESRQKTGAIAPGYRVYIEGVEVKFEQIVISNIYGRLPSATLTLPYLPYLQEICRNYEPKVHIFYRDPVTDRFFYGKTGAEFGDGGLEEQIRRNEKLSYRLLFSGVIKKSSYSKSKGPDASTSIVFACEHKNTYLNDILMSFARFAFNEVNAASQEDTTGSNAGLSAWNPAWVAGSMMQGVDINKVFDPSSLVNENTLQPASGTAVDPSGMPVWLTEYASQFRGVPGTILRLWNLMARDSHAFSYISDIMLRVYYPLVKNLKVFEGMTGHPILESYLSDNKVQTSPEGGDFEAASYISPRQPAATAGVQPNEQLKAASVEATLRSVMSGVQNFGQVSPMLEFITQVLSPMLYDVITLASPVMRYNDGKLTRETGVAEIDNLLGSTVAPVETIIRPLMPMYFSPRCNVVYPRMFTRISVTDDCSDAPTRTVYKPSAMLDGAVSQPAQFRYRAPINVREAVALRARGPKITSDDLLDTPQMYAETPAAHEMGRGVRPRTGEAPGWLQYIMPRMEAAKGDTSKGFRQMFLDYTDYQHSISVSGTRTGDISSVFNPYIVVGYPMDIIDASQDRPNYHAFCTSVVHTISGYGEASTSVGFTNAMTHEEVYAYEHSGVLPWIAELLKVHKDSERLYGHRYVSLAEATPETREAANTYYEEVLGVGAAFMEELTEYKFAESQGNPDTDMVKVRTKTLEDSLASCRRSIQTLDNVEQVFGMRFIHLHEAAPANAKVLREYPFRTGFNMSDGNQVTFTVSRARVGHSLFLDYSNYLIRRSARLAADQERLAQATTDQASEGAVAGNKPGDSGSNPNVNALANVKGGPRHPFPINIGVDSTTDWIVRDDYVDFLAALKNTRPADHAMVLRMEAELSKIKGYKANVFSQLIWAESGYRHYKKDGSLNKSGTGACGYGQLIPRWWNAKARALFSKDVPDLAPSENLYLSAMALRDYLMEFKGNVNDAVVAYNQGNGTVKGKGSGAMKGARVNGVTRYSLCIYDQGGHMYFHLVFKDPMYAGKKKA